MSRIDFLTGQMLSTRAYTLRVLEHTDPQRWFEMPQGPGCQVTHIAWQVGHLAFAEYAHFICMICGQNPADQACFPKDRYFSLFAKGTAPQAQGAGYPQPPELLATLDSLHEHCLQRLQGFDESLFDLPTLLPHQIAHTRFDMALWWIKHEMLHVGQIALLRRLLGESPWR